MSLITTGQMIKEKPSLLGEAYIQRTTSSGLFLFHSALFNYSLIPLELIFRFDPLPITIFFTFLNFFTGFLIYFFVKKITNPVVGWFSTFLFLFNAKMIHHSLFVWTLNYLPLIGLLSLWQMWILFKKRKALLPILFLGILSGVGFGLQYVYAISAFLIFLYILLFSKKKILGVVLYFLGAAIGDLPMILFDIKHNFYHLNSLYQYFLDSQSHKVAAFYTYYQFLNFWPLFAIVAGLLLWMIFKRNKIVVVALLLGYLFFNLVSPFTRIFSGGLKPEEVTLADTKKVASLIAKTNPPTKFNVAVLLDFDTRANPLRYILTYQHNLKPQPVENYNDIDALYVLSLKDYDMQQPRVWELQTYLPYKINFLDAPTSNHLLYKLTK